MSGHYPLTYVCKFCGVVTGIYPSVVSTEPATLSVCDKVECRAQASAAYKGKS